MNIMRRKPSAGEKLNAPSNAPPRKSNQAPPSLDTPALRSTARPGAGLKTGNTLPDLRLSGFDIDKMMGQAGLGSPSPLGTTDDEDLIALSYRDYMTTKPIKKRTVSDGCDFGQCHEHFLTHPLPANP